MNRHEYEAIGGDEDEDVSLVSVNKHQQHQQQISQNNQDGDGIRRYSVSFAEVVHRKENPKKFEKTIPRDAYSMARIMFLLMGSGILVPGICFQLSVDWFTLIFPTPSPDSFNLFDFLEYILSFGFNIGQLTSMIIYTIFMWRKSVHTLKAQTFTVEQFIFLGYALNFVCVLVTLFINVILVNQYGFNNNEQTYDKIFMLTCEEDNFSGSNEDAPQSIASIGNLNGDGDDITEDLDTQSLITEKAEVPDISVNMNDFGITWLSLMRKLWSPGLGIFVTFLTTFSLTPGLITDIRYINEGKDIHMSWNPIITLSIFNIFDLIIFCVNPLYITQPIWFSIILALFGLTNGYCCSIGMASGPSVVKTGEQEKAAYLMNFFLNTGLLFGSAIGIGCGYLVHFAW
ncbi:predicted protein [Naegleria gruberi]|uniref:Predicted protein n=1 Tax=Naegleria gruberi TaxID=5762 RepID=D2VM14_NAEGR|nr:uncharacterized protein NAEGRDRAFT_80500 [Naegleria gruberi]EFC42242.1 predicted protein [Naegleria gruberi]|eukprot:XP_002674986.1 predicted protein [Naegleria gruberi strain NEG-M]